MAGTDITVNAYLRATGSRPLVLIASGSIITTMPFGLIDVGSHRIRAQQVPEVGAGADPAACAPGVFPGSGGGGAGGSFVARGGIGGVGGGGGNGGTPGEAVATVGALRGGCPGQDGQGPTSDKGLAGHGGGAVYLIAGVRIDVQGGINAAGEGGTRGIAHVSGGGGGGAGDMIGFDAPVITCNSLLLASGGGGGGGSGPDDNPGSDGSDPSTTLSAPGGEGFIGNNYGGRGGGGSVASVFAPGALGLAGHLNTFPGGGGGGGGGAGLVSAPLSADHGTNVSPPNYALHD